MKLFVDIVFLNILLKLCNSYKYNLPRTISGVVRSQKFYPDAIFNEARNVFKVENDVIEELEVSRKFDLMETNIFPRVNKTFIHDHSSNMTSENSYRISYGNKPSSIKDEDILFIVYDKFLKKKFFDSTLNSNSTVILNNVTEISSKINEFEKTFDKNSTENYEKDGLLQREIKKNPFKEGGIRIDTKNSVVKKRYFNYQVGSTTIKYDILKSTVTRKYKYSSLKLNNHLRGSPTSVCLDNGTIFSFETIKPFSGKIFIKEKQNDSNCYFNFTNVLRLKIYFYYKYCLSNISADTIVSNYIYNINIIFDNNAITPLSYTVKCLQKHDTFVKNVDSTKVVDNTIKMKIYKSLINNVPIIEFKIIKNYESKLINETKMGEIKFFWKLKRFDEVYNFLITNCVLLNKNKNYTIIDKRGCSINNTILSHPHYNIWNKTVSSKFLAFQLFDIKEIKIQCTYKICTTSKEKHGLSHCDNIGLPPSCSTTY